MTGNEVKGQETEVPSVWAELTTAQVIKIGGLVLITFAAYAVLLLVAWAVIPSANLEKLGQVGDSFGVLTSLFNALAFAGLIATVVLQSNELRQSREQLRKQAEAQAKLAAATARQIEVTQQLEATRLRPFIKAEWEEENEHLRFWIRNVGLGVAIVRSIELHGRGTQQGFFGTVKSNNFKVSRSQWRECLGQILVGSQFEYQFQQFNDLNRALAPGETQTVIQLRTGSFWDEEEVARLRGRFRPVVHFESVTGEAYSTKTQVKIDIPDPDAVETD